MNNPAWKNTFTKLTSLAVSSSSWKCRLASYHKLENFAKETNTEITWPLNENIINGFIIWAFKNKEISSKTTKTYLCHLNSIQKLLGFKKFNIKKHNFNTLLTGFKNGEKLNKNQKKIQRYNRFFIAKKNQKENPKGK